MEEVSGIKIESSDGALLKGIKISLNNTLAKLKSGWKMSVFARCFPSLAEGHNSTLEAIRSSVLEPLIETLCSELSSIIDEELAAPLNNFSSFVKSRSVSQHSVTWRPSGSPEQDIIAHDAKVLQYEKQKLLAALESQRKKNLQLYEQVKAGREQCNKNHLEIERHLNKLKELEALGKAIPLREMTSSLEKDMLSSVGRDFVY